MDYEPGEKERVRDEMERQRRAENEKRRQGELERMKGNRHQRRKLEKVARVKCVSNLIK